LRDAVQQELGQRRRSLVVPHRPPARVTVPRAVATSRLVHPTPSSGVRHERRVEHERHAARLERFHLVKRLEAAGLSAAAIMRETGIGRKSVAAAHVKRARSPASRYRSGVLVGSAAAYFPSLLTLLV
jgi:hypothetical protein